MITVIPGNQDFPGIFHGLKTHKMTASVLTCLILKFEQITSIFTV